MTKTSILCYQKNGGSCRNRVSPANNYICGAGHGGGGQANSVSPSWQKIAPAIDLSRMSNYQKRALAKDPSTPPETLAQLAGDGDESVRAAVAGNRSASPETLAQMARDKSSNVCRAVAGNRSASPETLAQLAGDKDDWGVHRAVAGNRSASPETLAQLARDMDNWGVRRAVAGNRSASPETLAQLAGDKDRDIRGAVAGNSSASPETHISLAQQGHAPLGFAKGKSIDGLIKDINLVDQYPDTFGMAYLSRLLERSLQEDASHPKRRALIGYVYAKHAESETDGKSKQLYKNKIKGFFPSDQEIAEIVGY